jgi:predicted dehydrogenase
MKIGLVGMGNFSRGQHTPALLKCCGEKRDIEIVACDPSVEARHTWLGKFGEFKVYESDTAMLTAEKLDAAYILVPPALCCDTVLKFLAAGIPVFTEKPPGISPEETRKLIRAAVGIPHAVGFNRRFSPILRLLKKLSEEKDVAPGAFCCEFMRASRYDPDFSTTFIHGIDALRYLGGDFSSFSAEISDVNGDKPYRNITIGGFMQSGALIQMNIMPVSGRAIERYRIIGREVTLEARPSMPGLSDTGEILLFREGKVAERWSEKDLKIEGLESFERSGFYDQAKQFLNGLQNSSMPLGTSFSEALQSVEIVKAIKDAPAGSVTWKA